MTVHLHRFLLLTLLSLVAVPLTSLTLLAQEPIPPTSFRHIIPTGDQELEMTELDRLFLDGQYELALSLLNRQLANSENVAASQLHNRGLLERLTGNGTGLDDFRLAYEYDPEVLYPTWYYGRALLEADSLEQARVVLHEAVDLDDRYGESIIDLARCLRLLGEREAARNHLRSLVGGTRSDGDAYAELARTWLVDNSREGRREASAVLAEAYEQFPFEQVLRLWVPLLAEIGDRDHAADLAHEYLTLYPLTDFASEMRMLFRQLAPNRPLPPANYQQQAYDSGTPYAPPGEVLLADQTVRWKARWGLIRVGELSAEVSDGVYRGDSCWVARYTATSTVPFVSIADTFYAWIDRDLMHTHRLDMVYHEETDNARKTLENNYETGICENRVREPNGYWWHDRLPLPPNLFDTTSQLWFTQQIAVGGTNGTCNIASDHTFERTSIEVRGGDGDFDFNDREYDLVHVGGIMPYAGLAGMTGAFEGWLTAGRPVLPARARFKIFLGHITLDMIELSASDLTQKIMLGAATNLPQHAAHMDEWIGEMAGQPRSPELPSN